MPIDFEPPKLLEQARSALTTVAVEMMRSQSRYFDEHEHEIPWDYIKFMHTAMKASGVGSLAPRRIPARGGAGEQSDESGGGIGYQLLATQIEALAWGDVGMYLSTPCGGLGASARQVA